MAERIQRKRVRGWRLPAGARCVDRGTKWGNPFFVDRIGDMKGWTGWYVGERRDVYAMYGSYDTKPEAMARAVEMYELHTGPMGNYELDVDEVRRELGGRDLACYCPSGEPCHADVLLGLANAPAASLPPRSEIALPGGLVALIDEADWPLVSEYTWRAFRRKHGTYVRAHASTAGGRGPTVLLHRLIMSPDPGLHVDHINHDGLDNRRSNLRICTSSQNMGNGRLWSSNTSGYKGVSWRKAAKKWTAQIRVAGKRISLGEFDDAWEAAQAYNAAALEHFGEFALLNERRQP